MPFANTLPAIGIILLCLGLAERDGVLILLGYLVSIVSGLYIGALLWLAAKAGGNLDVAFATLREFLQRV